MKINKALRWGTGMCISLIVIVFACSDNASFPIKEVNKDYKTENVIVLVIDGPRYSETWGLEGTPHISYMANNMAPEGTLFTNFRNNGPTYTLAGHTALTTGHYQNIDNDGSEVPLQPSVFQHYLRQHQHAPEKACMVTSKLKLHALADSRELDWRGRYNPTVNSGEDGSNRSDKETFKAAIETLKHQQPSLMLVQFLGPDANGHANNWKGYINSIRETDSLAFELWQYLQTDAHYKGKTTLLITNDHGRHGNNHKDGFVSHGDGCEDCRHISLLALGPDFKTGMEVDDEYEQIDILPTIGQLMNIPLPESEGRPIHPLLDK